MLSAREIGVVRGGQTILGQVSLSVESGSRLGVVGPNGVGKSTLLAVLAGMVEPDTGSVERAPASLTVGFMAQESDGRNGETLIDYLARKTEVGPAGEELDRLTARLAIDPDVVEAYSSALEHFLALGGDDFEARAHVVMDQVGLSADRVQIAVDDLSGGQQARSRLAAILLSRFDVLLLDEPTNDLDFAGLDLLEQYVAGFDGAVVCVSHDRAFLDRAVKRVLEIDDHSRTGTEYAGAWSEYVERRELSRRQARATYDEWSTKRHQLQARAGEQRQWGVQGVSREKKNPRDNDKAQRDFRINRTEKQASKVRVTEKAIERLGRIDKPWEGWELHLDLSSEGRSGDVVSRLVGATVSRGAFSLGPLDLEIGWGERIAITGRNGGGKSTLIGALSGALPLSAGSLYLGPSVRFGHLDQTRSPLAADPDLGLGEAFVRTSGLPRDEGRSTLAKFGLGAEHVSRRWDQLSPGERTRARLALLMVERVNTLILDEPTNHLDVAAIEQIEQALDDFAGTLIVVTHDRWLLDNLAVTRRLEIEEGQLIEA